MNDGKASLVAAAFGSVAIGGFWLVRPMKLGATLRVVDQWTPSTRDGPDGDAAALIRVDLRGAGHDDESPIQYRVVGRDGSSYGLVPSAAPGALGILKLPRGYSHRLDSPRLVARSANREFASAALRPLPVPEFHPLTPSSRPPFALVLRGDSGLFAEPKSSIPGNERWRVTAIRTPFADGLNAISSVAPSEARYTRRLAVPFADEAGLVEVEFTRYGFIPQSEVIHLKGMRLQRRFGGTALIVDHGVRVRSRLDADIQLPRQDNGPRHAVRHGNGRFAALNLTIVPVWFASLPPELQRGSGPKVEILQPTPESLGLQELRIASQSRRSHRPPIGPLREGPFAASLRVTFFRPIAIEKKRLVVPVTFGAPLPFSRSQMASNVAFFGQG